MELTPKKRLLNTITRKEIDRLPSDIWLSKYFLNILLEEINDNEDKLMDILDRHIVLVYSSDSHLSWNKKDELNDSKKYCKQSADGKTMYDSWGVGYDITQEGICIKYNPVPDDFNLENYKFPDPNGSHLLDRAKMIKEKYKDKYCIVPLLGFGIFERAYTLRGFGNFLIDMKTNKKFAEELLDKITEYQLSLAKRFIDMGIDCVMDSNDFGTQENLIMSVDDWKKFIMPRLKKIWDLFKKEKIPVILHSCGNIIKIIPYLIEIGLDVLNPIQHVMDPELLKKQFGKDIVFFGGIDSQNLLTNGNPEEIKREVKRYIQILGKDGGYIIAPDQCLMSNVPVINILTLVKAIKEYSYLPFR